MKKINSALLCALAFTALVGCDKNKMEPEGSFTDEHEQISFSLSDGMSTKAGFTANTRIVARFQSDEKGTSNVRYTKTFLSAAVAESGKDFSKVNYLTTPDDVRYWDDAFGRKGQISVYAVAIPNSTVTTKLTDNILSGAATWTAEATPNNSMSWSVTPDQSGTFDLNSEDLVYSNNIQSSGSNGIYRWDYANGKYAPDETGGTSHLNGRMLFFQQWMDDDTKLGQTPTSAPGHFDKGHLVFNHALSRVTITVKSGTGFDAATKFILSADGIQLLNMNVAGSLNVATGVWTAASTGATANIVVKPAVVRPSAPTTFASYSATAQMLPDYVITDASNTNMFQFTIDDNTYYVTQDMVYDALKANTANTFITGTTVTMEQGKNYKFTLTVNKTKIESVTASVANWTPVSAAEEDLHNSYITISDMKDSEGTVCNNFDLWRMPVDAGSILTDQTSTTAASYENFAWFGNYTDKATLTGPVDNVWKTNWVYADNKTFYHFRSLTAGTTIKEASTSNDDCFEIVSGAAETTDPHWGAPMLKTYNSSALTNDIISNGYVPTADASHPSPASTRGNEGYSKYIYKAIGSTESNIAIQEFHMMSKILVVLKTKTTGVSPDALAADGVELAKTSGGTTTYTTVTLKNFYEKADVKLGSGLVTPTGTPNKTSDITTPSSDYWQSSPGTTKKYSWCVVPQLVDRGSGNGTVGLEITTPDNNKYYVNDLSQIAVSGTTNKITRWIPNHTYTYTFTLSKTKIESVTCSVAAWIDVNAENKDLDLES